MSREYSPAPARRPRADAYPDAFDDRFAVVRDLTVFEPRDEWRGTGLLDASGTPLMRRERFGPIGFIHHQDRDA
jgi:hypothetical protein